jgi:DNA polymerase-3 subunit epsilon
MQHQITELDDLARELEETGDYRVLRRLKPREPTPTPAGYTGELGILIDFETTGVDPAKDEIIEVAMVKFRYSDGDEITGICDIFQSFNQPSRPIPAEIVKLTGITDAMVAGHTIDAEKLEAFVSDAQIVIAHNAAFDRPFAEQSWKLFAHKPWACSASEVGWRMHGFAGSRLAYLLAGAGFFHDAHRAVDDCQALIEILARPLPTTSGSAFAVLMAKARRKTVRIWAERSPFELKDVLKRRGYRWNDGSDGRPRSWYIDVDEDKRNAELDYLKKEIFQRNVDIHCSEITALDRFSNRA